MRQNIELHKASLAGDLDGVRSIIQEGKIDVNSRDAHDMTPLHVASANGDNVQIVRELIKADADLDAQNKWGQTPLHRVSFDGRNLSVIELLRSGCNYELTDDKNQKAYEMLGVRDDTRLLITGFIERNPEDRGKFLDEQQVKFEDMRKHNVAEQSINVLSGVAWVR